MTSFERVFACLLATAWLGYFFPTGILAQSTAEARRSFVDQYCLGCHSRAAASGGLALEGVPAQDPAAHAKVWEKVITRVSAGEMPPAGTPRPEEGAARDFVEALVGEIDEASKLEPYAGRTVIRRLNRVEYQNAIRDLLAVELPLADQLPPDGQAGGFDNIGDALSMSPLLLEQYLKVRSSRRSAGGRRQ